MTRVMKTFAKGVNRICASLLSVERVPSASTQSSVLSTSPLHRLLLLCVRGGLAGLQCRELLLGRDVAGLAAQSRQPCVERGVGQLLGEVGLGDGVLDVVADVVERADLVVDREAAELVLDSHPRLRR